MSDPHFSGSHDPSYEYGWVLAPGCSNTTILTRIAGEQLVDLEACTGGGTSSGSAAGAALDADGCNPTALGSQPI